MKKIYFLIIIIASFILSKKNYVIYVTAQSYNSLNNGYNDDSAEITITELPTCEADFSFQVDSNSTQPYRFFFKDKSSGNITSWHWEFDDGNTSNVRNPIHVFDKEGTFNVCLLISNDSTGCFDSICYPVTMPEYFLMGGFAYTGSSPINNPVHEGDTGIATLYRRKSNNTVQVVDSNIFMNLGYFWFSGILGGNYIIRIKLSDQSTHSENYLPTYFNNSYTWQNADLITMLDTHAYSLDTYMIPINANLTGPGSISGQIVYSEPSLYDKYFNIKGACVILQDQSGQAIDFSFADLSGYFTLNQIPLGSYRLLAEIPGKYSEVIEITLSNNQPSITSVMVEVFESNIHGIDETSKNILAGNVYPNPAKDQINISIKYSNTEKLKASVYDITGRRCLEKIINQVHLNDPVKLEVGHLNQGVYLLNITNPDGNLLITRKFVK